ncbi:MAG: M3 family oligoendopeptidase [Patescibacteria group bacterium]
MQGRTKTAWNLGLLYKSLKDPQIDRDMCAIEHSIEVFAKKYTKDSSYMKSEGSLLQALKSYEKLSNSFTSKPILYPHYTKELDSLNIEAESLLRRLEDRFTKAGNQIIFFSLNLGKIEPRLQKQFLKSGRLRKYRYMLERIWQTAKYDKTEPEEKILSLLSQPSYGLWVEGLEKSLSKRSVSYKNKKIPLTEGENLIRSLRTQKERLKLWHGVIEEYKSVSDFAESELNAVVIGKKIRDEIRGYKTPEEATIIGYENEPETVDTLVREVTKAFDISRDFYALKAKLMKEKKLTYADRSVPLKSTFQKVDFSKAVRMVDESFGSLHSRYADILRSFLKNGQIDVYPKKGKAGGAYCSSSHKLPTFVLLNHVNDFSSLLTLAHEMGHAIHGERSRGQGVLYEGYSTAVAETASTFFETAVFDRVTRSLPSKERVAAIHNRIQDEVQTVFRQIAFYNFEKELHASIRKEGSVSKERVVSMLVKHLKSYMGEKVELTVEDGYQFVTVSHFRRFFYVYSYAFGQLIARALLKEVKKNPKFIDKVDVFLSAGGSASPEDIFKNIGIDIRNPKFFASGLAEIRSELRELEHLAKDL